MKRIKFQPTALTQGIRLLSEIEVDAVKGGASHPTAVGGWVFVDQFASKLPSWVRPTPFSL